MCNFTLKTDKTDRMKGKLRYVAFLCAGVAGLAAGGRDVVWTELPTQGQLPVANIHCLLQDSEGYMWYGTEGGGLCRDDGYDIDVFRSDALTPRLLGSNSVTCLAEDGEQHIYIGTTEGLYVLDKSDYVVRPLVRDVPLASSRTDAVMVASDKSVWAAAQGRICHISPQGELLEEFPSEWRGRAVNVSGFCEDHVGRVFVSQWGGGLLRYEAGRRLMAECDWPYAASPGQMVEEGRTGRFWVATWGGGVVTYIPGTDARQGATVLPYPETGRGDDRSRVLGMAWDKVRLRLWVSSLDNLYAYDWRDGSLKAVDLEGVLPSGKKILDRPVADRWGNIWVPGYSPHTFILSRPAEGIRRDPVAPMTGKTGYPVMVDRIAKDAGGYWIWQGRTGLSYYDPAGGQLFMTSESASAPYPFSSVIAECGAAGGIYALQGERILHVSWEKGRFAVRNLGDVPARNAIVCKMSEDALGNLWVATDGGIYKKEDDRWHEMLACRAGVRDFLFLPEDSVCVLSRDGRLHLMDAQGRTKAVEADVAATALTANRDGTIWVGSAGGRVHVYVPSTGRLTKEENAGNADGDAIKGLASDRLGHVWILSDQYVKEYNPRNRSYRLLRNSDEDVRMDYFHTIKRMGDSICVGGIGAFCMIAPSAALDRPALPVRPVVSAYEVEGVRHFVPSGRRGVEFEAGQDNVSFSFSSLDHLHAGRISYACRLKGHGADWIHLPQGTNTVNFYNLSAGDYALEVKATDMHGCWGEAVEVLAVTCLPPWYATWWAYLIYFLLALSGMAGGLFSYLGHMRRRQQEQAERRLTEMKIRFFTNISHDLRTPLTLIITPLESLLNAMKDEGPHRQLLSIHRHACELLELMNQLLDFRKLETGEEKIHYREGDMADFVRVACEGFRNLAAARQTEFKVDTPDTAVMMRFDPDKMHRVLYNLLGNAFKFTPKGGRVEVRLEQEEAGRTVLTVSDTGCGIAAEDLPHVFDRYYQGDNGAAHAGSGIGLHLVRTYVEMHGGTVDVESRKGEGAAFRVALPPSAAISPPRLEPAAEEDGRRAVLVVEDNEELRDFLVRKLSAGYVVWQAADGREALSVLERHAADIVVSDVMMPGMDGYALCRALKEDVRTSHVSVILLTAYSGDENALKGYESGADCYLAKPFNMDILANRIRHFIDLQDRRKRLFLDRAEVRAEEIAPTKVDEEFLRKVVACVERHLDDTGYGVEQLSAEACMSRMNLYRKLQSLTGQSPSGFIRAIRLKKAAALLAGQGMTVAEVADRVGFSTPSYFSKCFREMFGVLPTQYRGDVSGSDGMAEKEGKKG